MICKGLPAHTALGNINQKARALPAIAQNVAHPMQSLGQHFTLRNDTSRGTLHSRTAVTEEKLQGTETSMGLGILV